MCPFVLLGIFAAVVLSVGPTTKGSLLLHEQRQTPGVLADIGMVVQKLFKHMSPEGGPSSPQVCRQPHH